MRIGIHNQPAGSALGGSEYSMAVLAEALSVNNVVEVIHHKPEMTREQLETCFGVSLSRVRVRRLEYDWNMFGDSQNLWRRYHEDRNWMADLSRPYDLFITFTHFFPPFCQAPVGILMVLFPDFDFNAQWPGITKIIPGESSLRRHFRLAYYRWKWRKRMETYQVKLAISQFTREWTQRLWDVDCDVVYPPVNTAFPIDEKESIILSVGRFAGSGTSKKQREMMAVFGALRNKRTVPWSYHCVGGLGVETADVSYYDSVRTLAATCGAQVATNLDWSALRHLFSRASIFWHAAGYGEDETQKPGMMEHFGITTVEAMAAGCVPVVVNKGGQKEIIEHGISGFLWNTLEELSAYTQRLMNDRQLRTTMAQAARQRAQKFSKENFIRNCLSRLQPFLS